MSENNLKISLKAENYKCFSMPKQGFDQLFPINVLIGKNNSGKSALLDLVKHSTNPINLESFKHKNKRPGVFLEQKITKEMVEASFRSDASGGGIPGNSHREYGGKFIEGTICVRVSGSNKEFVSTTPEMEIPSNVDSQFKIRKRLAETTTNPFVSRVYKKISAERDIYPEIDNSEVTIQDIGVGATNFIQNFINNSKYDQKLVTEIMLDSLNDIFNPDIKFDKIITQRYDNGKWEIYLEEKNKGTIKLSDSGSGIKTVILVLLYTILLPKLEGRALNQYVFAFEELENNLHPALQRKLLLYIEKLANEQDCIFFITTHSNVIIDLFGKSNNAQILHIRNNGESSEVKQVKTHFDGVTVLKDLDFRASDLLQSNGVIWVEGPSDRTYINHWINLISEGELKEGVHYQCVFYGGRLLSHLSADDPEKVTEAISILKVNNNSIIVMDSDKASSSAELNNTKKRVIEEMSENENGFVWVTEGREIENYIPKEVLEKKYDKETTIIYNKFGKIGDFLENLKTGEKERFNRNKVLFAENVIPLIDKNSISGRLDLEEKIEEVCQKIRDWNKISE
ncbi:ATP-binding protein [Patescibacteria group bacterium]|nr:ATP-binding protein [Patescibacteria group bacterium]